MQIESLHATENLYHLYREVKIVCRCLLENKGNNVVLLGITGGVAAGKSTLSRCLQKYIEETLPWSVVEIISTDNFIFPNHYLIQHNLTERKGFPETYAWQGLKKFIAEIKFGQQGYYEIPVYSQQEKDILPEKNKRLSRLMFILSKVLMLHLSTMILISGNN